MLRPMGLLLVAAAAAIVVALFKNGLFASDAFLKKGF